ncbi:glycosyltransferase family 9 protein [Kamptonema cortianum]|nr:glycosyltransferase family 9 protein [Oscillatoria laete-virens]MDK3156454.1 glycosyltransferase family 9 protein [Kamptonema cortianum]MDL5053864.1 glycosyltransferase family 9 protein [Oscillatoria laete-virens NRMC-F 0139]
MWNRLVFAFFKIFFQAASLLKPPTPHALPVLAERILVFSTAGIGDSITDSVAIRALKESHPGCRLMVVTHARRRIVHDHNPFVDSVTPHRKSPLTFFKTWSVIKKFAPNLVVVLRSNDPDIWPLAYLANRHAVVSTARMTKFDFLISHKIDIPNWDDLHGVEQTLDLVKSAGATTMNKRLVYQVTPDELGKVNEKFKGWINAKPLLILQLGGGKRANWRDWPAEHYISLIKLLGQRNEFELVLTGGMDQAAKALQITTDTGATAHNLAGRISLAETAALLKRSFALVSTDTGVMHLGFAVGTNVIALIHGNNPAHRVGPYGYGDKHLVIQLEAEYNSTAEKKASMSSITPEMVFEKIEFLRQREQIAPQS